MSNSPAVIDTTELERLASGAGLAVAIVGKGAVQIEDFNNNSICRNLNPGAKFSPACSRFCGAALQKAREAGKTIGFVCHAGLDCRAFTDAQYGDDRVVIVGRTFLSAENYRKATERAVSGDWKKYSPADLFENILLSGSTDELNDTTQKAKTILEKTCVKESEPAFAGEGVRNIRLKPVERTLSQIAAELPSKLVEPFEREPAVSFDTGGAKPSSGKQPSSPTKPADSLETKDAGRQSAKARAWRSFFGSILKTDYSKASSAILEFLAHQFGLSTLIWLDRRGDKFENTLGFGKIRRDSVRIGVSPDDPRLLNAFHNEEPLAIKEKTSTREMHLFPLGVDEKISAGVAVFDPLRSADIRKNIARICHSVAPQLEILRLRNEVLDRDAVATAVRRFGDTLRKIDSGDFWHTVTQATAEMLMAERASLLIADEKTGNLEIKAMIGGGSPLPFSGRIGGRVARVVYARNEAALVGNISETNLTPAPEDRKYRASSFFSFPISIGSRKIGVINFTDRDKPFDMASLELFKAIGPQLAIAVDRANLKEKAGAFEQLSVTDPLTGLLNRRYIEERLLEEVKRSNREGFPMSLMMLDVDHFKSYNDEFGHPAGDEALKIVAQVIRESLRGADVAARFGGEEFAILLPQTTGEEAFTIAERIRAKMESTRFPRRAVTASIGLASCSAEQCTSATLVSAADKALYAAKREGRNRVLVFDDINGARPV